MIGAPCAFHDQSMEQLRATLLDIKEQMREGIAALNQQSIAFQATITKIVEAQSARQALCAKQDQRLVSMERNQTEHREFHTKDREEYLTEKADMWSSVNKLRFHVYVGLGVGLVIQMIAPFVIVHILKG